MFFSVMWTMTPMPERYILIHSIQHGLRDGFKLLFWIYVRPPEGLTHPIYCLEQVLLTTKLSVTMGQQIRSREQMRDLRVFRSNPVMTGSV